MKTIIRQTILLAATLLLAGASPLSPAVAQPPAGAPAAASAFSSFPDSVDAASLTRADVGREVSVVGRVISVKPSTADNIPTQINLLPPDAEMPFQLVYWVATQPAVEGTQGPPAPGTMVSARGKLEVFKDRTLQIKIRGGDQIRIEGREAVAAPAATGLALDADGYATVEALAATGRAMVGANLSFRGKVQEFRAKWSDTAPNVISVGTDAYPLDVVYWSEDPSPFAEKGTPVFAVGRLQEHRGKLQIRVDDLTNLSTTPLPADRVVKAAVPTPTPKALTWGGAEKRTQPVAVTPAQVGEYASVPLKDIGAGHQGNKVTTEGRVTMVVPRPDGSAFARLEQDGAFLVVLLDPAAATRVKKGQTVVFRGKLEWYPERSQTILVPSEQEFILANQ